MPLILACSGGSNVGQITNQAALELTREGRGRMFCLAGLGADIPGIIKTVREAGETGEVVVTPFTLDYPLVRLATGDLSRLSEAPCACGRTSPKLMGILGRVDDTAKVKGQFIYPSQVAAAMARFPQILRHQVVIGNAGGRDSLTLRIETNGPVDAATVAAAFQETAKLRPAVTVLGLGETIPEGVPALVDERTYD